VKKVTKTGAGASMLDDADLACRLVEAVATASRLPVSVKMRRGVENGSRTCLEIGPQLVEAGASSLTLHPRSARQMYTGEADHSLTAELVELVSVPVIASGDVTSRARAQAVVATTGAAAVMVGRAAQGNPWVLREMLDEAGEDPTREEVVAELVLFMRETVRELGERRASGFLKKFYGWYLGRGRFQRPFKQELVQLETVADVDAGAVGLVLNRPTEAEVAEAVPDLAEVTEPGAIVSIGGPVQTDSVVVLAEWDDHDEAGAMVFRDVGLMGAEAESERVAA